MLKRVESASKQVTIKLPESVCEAARHEAAQLHLKLPAFIAMVLADPQTLVSLRERRSSEIEKAARIASQEADAAEKAARRDERLARQEATAAEKAARRAERIARQEAQDAERAERRAKREACETAAEAAKAAKHAHAQKTAYYTEIYQFMRVQFDDMSINARDNNRARVRAYNQANPGSSFDDQMEVMSEYTVGSRISDLDERANNMWGLIDAGNFAEAHQYFASVYNDLLAWQVDPDQFMEEFLIFQPPYDGLLKELGAFTVPYTAESGMEGARGLKFQWPPRSWGT